ncbi:YkvI family membrane protein [Caldibacillus thermoamylovorans]
MRKKTEWAEAWQIAAVYVGTVIGAGFATGREIIEFFTRYGTAGTVGVAVSGALFTWGGARLMVMARRLGAASYDELNRYLFGKRLSPLVTFVMTCMVAGVTAVMIAGAGAVFEEQLGWPRQAGIALTLGAALAVMLLDRKGLFGVNVFVVPMMVLFSVTILLKMATAGHLCRPGATAADYSLKAMMAPFSYAAFNLAMAQAVLVPVAREAANERVVKRGAVLGGLLLTGLLLLNHTVLLSFPHHAGDEIPMAQVVRTFFAVLYWFYVVVIYGEIFTSVIGGLFGLERQARAWWPGGGKPLGVLLVLLFAAVSPFRYGELLSMVYPLFGYISVCLLWLLWRRPMPKR